jgi:hypothetical protein
MQRKHVLNGYDDAATLRDKWTLCQASHVMDESCDVLCASVSPFSSAACILNWTTKITTLSNPDQQNTRASTQGQSSFWGEQK